MIFKCNLHENFTIIVCLVVILGVEKNNHEAKAYFHSGNRHNGARDIILTEARLEQLEHDTPTCVRQTRAYNKSDTEYREKRIIENRKRPETSED